MRTEILIVNGSVKFILTPENHFEIEALHNADSENYTLHTTIESKCDFGVSERSDYKLMINLREPKK